MSDLQALLAAKREEIARIIDPWGWDPDVAKAWGEDTCEIHATIALAKADAIIGLMAVGGGGEGGSAQSQPSGARPSDHAGHPAPRSNPPEARATPPSTCVETIDGDPDTAIRLSFQIKVF